MGGGKGGIKRRMMAGWRAEARSLPLGSVDRVCPAAIFFIFFYFRLIGFISLLLFVPRQMVVLSARTEGHTLSKRTRRRITITAFHPRTRPCDPLPPKRGPDLPSSVSLLLSHCSPPGPMYLPLSAVFPSVFHFPPDRLHTDLVLVSLPRQLLLVFTGRLSRCLHDVDGRCERSNPVTWHTTLCTIYNHQTVTLAHIMPPPLFPGPLLSVTSHGP